MTNNRITGREKQVLRLIDDGLTNKQIASELDVNIETINSHCKKIYRKLQVKDRFEAAYLANKNGFLD